MKRPRLRTIFLVLIGGFALFYLTGVYLVATDTREAPAFDGPPAGHETIAIFGATGTAGDGILEAALADPGVRQIHVITRRPSPRIEAGVAAGKVVMTQHMDYLDYSVIINQLAAVDAVFWALGTSSLGVDEETYGKIHVDFPAQFVQEWLAVAKKRRVSFHYISSSDISENSDTMWVREKIRAEKTIEGLTKGTAITAVFYRPDYIGPTEAEAHLGQRFLYGVFAPVGVAIKARQIGQAMLEISARRDATSHGTRLPTSAIKRYSNAWEDRRAEVGGGQG